MCALLYVVFVCVLCVCIKLYGLNKKMYFCIKKNTMSTNKVTQKKKFISKEIHATSKEEFKNELNKLLNEIPDTIVSVDVEISGFARGPKMVMRQA